MSKKHYSFAGAFMLLLSLVTQDTKPTVADLAWLAGCWDGSTAKREYSEQWMKPSGQTLLGMSRTVVNGKTVAFEFLQIREQEGEIYYIAKPSGQAEASFKLIKHGKQEAVFENPGHDFPQRIIYRLAEDGSLAAAIEGMSNGKMKKIDFLMKRIACD